ncbi:hypothetical protein CEXT_680721 [Caerostris extrusa]|uniref:Uncharacterized protein n=1 Tax=Caerostris extrusa TaxID=172846 RepID=A0AAV4NCF6_CAEEX|nr:hypothetical protein CEXT_680721 [Caerostris extrusa]
METNAPTKKEESPQLNEEKLIDGGESTNGRPRGAHDVTALIPSHSLSSLSQTIHTEIIHQTILVHPFFRTTRRQQHLKNRRSSAFLYANFTVGAMAGAHRCGQLDHCRGRSGSRERGLHQCVPRRTEGATRQRCRH